MYYIAAYVLGLATYPLVYGLYWLWIYLFVKDVTIRCVRCGIETKKISRFAANVWWWAHKVNHL